jgi:hypothetical protein
MYLLFINNFYLVVAQCPTLGVFRWCISVNSAVLIRFRKEICPKENSPFGNLWFATLLTNVIRHTSSVIKETAVIALVMLYEEY